MESTSLCFSDIDWCEDEAKNDYSLERYFVEFPGFNNVLTGKKRGMNLWGMPVMVNWHCR